MYDSNSSHLTLNEMYKGSRKRKGIRNIFFYGLVALGIATGIYATREATKTDIIHKITCVEQGLIKEQQEKKSISLQDLEEIIQGSSPLIEIYHCSE